MRTFYPTPAIAQKICLLPPVSRLWILFVGALWCSVLYGQPTFTANDTLFPIHDPFRAGVNLGQIPPYTDVQLAQLASGIDSAGLRGVGVTALRPLLAEDFLENYGYDARLATFETYASMGLGAHTCIVGYPTPAHRDSTYYCAAQPSVLFKNLYAPIWDNGENGTPVNDTNYYALYIYKMATLYQPYIKYWEVWNEPGFDYTRIKGSLPPGSPGNWWDNNPEPCDYKLRAPIFHFVRTLRISYEVLKTVDPAAQIVLSGTGFPSFLDAILRNTDNPIDGQPTALYPLGGGAYFDVMGFHSYPHFDGALREWNNATQDWTYYRHSDAAAQGIARSRQQYQTVLDNYGYNDVQYPAKRWTITEGNIPRKRFDAYIGSDSAQANFLIKAYVACVKQDFLQYHVYALSEEQRADLATYEFGVMGLYEKLKPQQGLHQTLTAGGKAYRFVATALAAYRYDANATAQLNLPPDVDGAVLVHDTHPQKIVLWAKTTQDLSEDAQATYTLPVTFQNTTWEVQTLAQSDEGTFSVQSGAQSWQLTATPIILSEQLIILPQASTRYCPQTPVGFSLAGTTNVTAATWHFEGGVPAVAQGLSVSAVFAESGKKIIRCVGQTAGGDTLTLTQSIWIEALPVAAFDTASNGALWQFTNQSSLGATHFSWLYGDGLQSTDFHTQHWYHTAADTYLIQLIAHGGCGNDTVSQLIATQPHTPALPLAYTALDAIAPPNDYFRAGSNFAYYPPWSDEQLADIAAGNILNGVAGLGVQSFGALLPHYFLEGFGYEVRVSTFEHFGNVGLRSNVATVGFPNAAAQDTYPHCTGGVRATLFKNLYQPIWDNNANGTPYHDDNIFAKYIYETVKRYHREVKYWQVLNAPDYDNGNKKGALSPAEYGNWWLSEPDPCDVSFGAPIYYYNRMVRILYEVVKSIDSTNAVLVGGLGFPSFLDALLRTTDNPIDGSVTADFPYTTGAYIDAVGLAMYPNFDNSVRYYDLSQGQFVDARHSDAAVSGITRVTHAFKTVLKNRGFDEVQYPEKQFVVSACNVPRLRIDNSFGGDMQQVNYLLKALVKAQANGYQQLMVASLAERTSLAQATHPFDVMGLYQRIENNAPPQAVPAAEGIAFHTYSQLLQSWTYDSLLTQQLNLPTGADGGVFRKADALTFVLWAKTSIDNDEYAAQTYTLPVTFGIGQLFKKQWDYSVTAAQESVGTTAISLQGTPIFLSTQALPLQLPEAAFVLNSAATICPAQTVSFQSAAVGADSLVWEFEGGTPSISHAAAPTVSYAQSGVYSVRLTAYNAYGQHTFTKTHLITVAGTPTAAFSYQQTNSVVQFDNQSTGATAYLWDFGDGVSSQGFFPTHTYWTNDTFTIRLIATNGCQSDTAEQLLILQAPPTANFGYQADTTCAPVEVLFYSSSYGSPTTHEWTLAGAVPAFSTQTALYATYADAGRYAVQLIVRNEWGSDTLVQELPIYGTVTTVIRDTLCGEESVLYNGTWYNAAHLMGIEVFPYGATGGCDSLLDIQLVALPQGHMMLTDTLVTGETYMLGDSIFSMAGNYVVWLANGTPCPDSITLDLREVPNGVHETAAGTLPIWVQPNPVQQQLTVVCATDALYRYQLHNQWGQVVLSDIVKTKQWQVAVAHLPTGIYYLMVWSDAGYKLQKVVKL